MNSEPVLEVLPRCGKCQRPAAWTGIEWVHQDGMDAFLCQLANTAPEGE